MPGTPAISVVMAVYNRPLLCAEAIDSILAQSWRDFEFIIVNDGSTDGTASMLDAYAGRDARIRVIHQEKNQGVSACVNLGMAQARADWIARMDSDDLADPERFERQMGFLRQHPEVAAVGTSYRVTSVDGQAWSPPHRGLDAARLREVLVTDSVVAQPTVIMRRSTVMALGGYRSTFDLAEDYDLWLRLSEQVDMVIMPDILLHVRLQKDGASTAHVSRQHFIAEVARWTACLRRTGRTDPFNAVDRHDDRTMLEMLDLSPEEKKEFGLRLIRLMMRRDAVNIA